MMTAIDVESGQQMMFRESATTEAQRALLVEAVTLEAEEAEVRKASGKSHAEEGEALHLYLP